MVDDCVVLGLGKGHLDGLSSSLREVCVCVCQSTFYRDDLAYFIAFRSAFV